MSFKSNLNELTLLGNQPIKVYFDDKIVTLMTPSIKLYLMDPEFQEFYNILSLPIDEFNKSIKEAKIIVETRYGIFQTVIKLFPERLEPFSRFIKVLFPDLKLKDLKLYSEDTEIKAEEFDYLFELIAVSCAEKPIKGIHTPKPVNSKQAEMEEKIRKLKNKTKVNPKEEKKVVPESKITIDQIVIAIMYEFPSLTLDRIYDMNMFTLLHFWSYVSKVVDNQIQIVAAGNGHIKKFTYFIN